MERSIRFYKDGLGFQTDETKYDPPVIFFKTSSGLLFELCSLDLLAEDIGDSKLKKEPGFTGVTLGYMVKSRNEVEFTVEKARMAGAKIEKEPQDVFWGGYHAYFSDPDGHHWEVAYGPDFKFDNNDMLSSI